MNRCNVSTTRGPCNHTLGLTEGTLMRKVAVAALAVTFASCGPNAQEVLNRRICEVRAEEEERFKRESADYSARLHLDLLRSRLNVDAARLGKPPEPLDNPKAPQFAADATAK